LTPGEEGLGGDDGCVEGTGGCFGEVRREVGSWVKLGEEEFGVGEGVGEMVGLEGGKGNEKGGR